MTKENIEEKKAKPKKKAASSTKTKVMSAVNSTEKNEADVTKKESRTVKSQLKKINQKMRVSVPLLNVRKEAEKTSEIMRVVHSGDELIITAQVNGFGRLEDGTGYVNLDFVEAMDEQNLEFNLICINV